MTIARGGDGDGRHATVRRRVRWVEGGTMTPARRSPPADDEVWAAAEELVTAFRVAASFVGTMQERVDYLHERRQAGSRFADLIDRDARLVLLEATNTTLQGLLTAGTRLRRLVAQVLYGDGMTMDEIAKVLGVTRQRVSTLISADPDAPGPPWTRQLTGRSEATEND